MAKVIAKEFLGYQFSVETPAGMELELSGVSGDVCEEDGEMYFTFVRGIDRCRSAKALIEHFPIRGNERFKPAFVIHLLARNDSNTNTGKVRSYSFTYQDAKMIPIFELDAEAQSAAKEAICILGCKLYDIKHHELTP